MGRTMANSTIAWARSREDILRKYKGLCGINVSLIKKMMPGKYKRIRKPRAIRFLRLLRDTCEYWRIVPVSKPSDGTYSVVAAKLELIFAPNNIESRTPG